MWLSRVLHWQRLVLRTGVEELDLFDPAGAVDMRTWYAAVRELSLQHALTRVSRKMDEQELTPNRMSHGGESAERVSIVDRI
jgi:hypothetical protein